MGYADPTGFGSLGFPISASTSQACNSTRRSQGLLKTSRNGARVALKLESELKSGKRARRPHLAARIVSTACYFICCFSGHLVLISRIAQLRAGGKIKLCPLKIFISVGSDRVLRVGEVTAISFYSLPCLWAYSWSLGWLAAAAQGWWLALPQAWYPRFASQRLLHRCRHHLSSSFMTIPHIFQT